MLDLRFLSFLLRPSKKPPNGEDFFSLLSATCSPLLLRCPPRCLMGQLTLVQGQLTLIQGQPSTGEPCWVFTPWHHLICVVLLHMLRHFGCRNGSVATWSLPRQLLSQGGRAFSKPELASCCTGASPALGRAFLSPWF